MSVNTLPLERNKLNTGKQGQIIVGKQIEEGVRKVSAGHSGRLEENSFHSGDGFNLIGLQIRIVSLFIKRF